MYVCIYIYIYRVGWALLRPSPFGPEGRRWTYYYYYIILLIIDIAVICIIRGSIIMITCYDDLYDYAYCLYIYIYIYI